jgi:hypothetical protein
VHWYRYVPARVNVLFCVPDERLEIVLKRLLPTLTTLWTVEPSRNANETLVPFEIERLFGEKAMFFRVTVRLPAALEAATWLPSAATEARDTVRRRMGRLCMLAIATTSKPRIMSWRVDGVREACARRPGGVRSGE